MNGTISDEEERSPGGSISWSSDFIVVEAELPATTALLAVYGSTSRWVVIRRHGGRHLYVFRDDEVSNHPALSRWLATHAGMADATLADVLDLHEHQESTPTATKVSVCGAAWEPLPQLVGKPNAADAGPSATRYVLMDAAGMPREVGVSAADARRARPPHRGAGAVREAAAEAAATEAVDISARDEGRSPIRHPAITPDAPPSPGRPISLSVDLKRQADPDTEGGAITFDAPADWTELRVRFQLVCPAIEFERATGEVIVKRNAASLPDVCRGTVRAGLAAGTSIDVTAVFLHDGRFSGTAVRRLTNRPGPDGGPFFSKDGSLIVFRGREIPPGPELDDYRAMLNLGLWRPSKLELFVMDRDGKNLRQVTRLNGASFAPYIHPDNTRIIFSSNIDDPKGRDFELYLVKMDGTGLERVTFNDSFDGFPMFSPDGRRLVFASGRSPSKPGDLNIFIADWVE